jgi:hypothetical protein
MREINPYEPPAVLESEALVDQSATKEVWRDGRAIVAPVISVLPRRCVMTNEAAIAYHELCCLWYPNLLLAITHGRKIHVIVPIGRHEVARVRQLQRCGGKIGIAVGLALTVAAGYLFSLTFAAVVLLLSIVVLVVFLRSSEASPLCVYKATDQFVWLLGAGKPFLASLPQWPDNHNSQ